MKVIELDRPTMNEFSERVEKLNRRAAKLGVPPITWREVGSRVHEWQSPNVAWVKHAVEIVAVEVSENVVRLNGWEFVAVCEKIGEDSIIRTFADVDLSQFRGRDDCEHCRRNIRRRHLLVVRNVETGEMKLVGRSCVKDYIGHADAVEVALLLKKMYEYVEDFEDRPPEERIHASAYGREIKSLVAKSRAIIRHCGWVSRREAQEEYGKVATADIYLADGKEARAAEVTAEDREVAEKAVAWAAALPTDSGDYLNNLRVLATVGVVRSQHIGLAVSLIRAYQRELDRVADDARRAAGSTSTHVGDIGQRIERELKAVSFREMGKNPYGEGVRVMVKFTDDEGNVYVWWTTDTTAAYDELDNDKAVQVRATVKKHGEFRGEKQTTLARVSVKH